MGACKLERNIRIYKVYKRGMRLARIAEFEHLSTQRVYQIVAATELQLANGTPKYIEAYHLVN